MSQSGVERLQLTDEDAGVFLVSTTSGSTYRFDLDTRTVERVGGEPRRQAAPADSLQPLRGLIEVRVGRPARFWVRNTSGGFTDPSEIWQYTSTVQSIRCVRMTGDEVGDDKKGLLE